MLAPMSPVQCAESTLLCHVDGLPQPHCPGRDPQSVTAGTTRIARITLGFSRLGLIFIHGSRQGKRIEATTVNVWPATRAMTLLIKPRADLSTAA